jgi:hypothetical protein
MFEELVLAPDASPGGTLDAILAADVGGLDDDQVLTAICALERVIAAAQAAAVRACARFAELRPGPGPDGVDEFAADELGCELSVTRNSADARLDLALALTRRLPGTLAALGRGDIDLHKARTLADVTSALTDEQAGAVEARVLPRAGQQTAPQLRQSARRAVLRIDPKGAKARHEQRRAERKVELWPAEDGMADLHATLPAPQATAIYHRLDTLARNAGPGETRSMDQRRADAMVDLLLATNPAGAGGVAAQVHLTVPATTLAGQDDVPGDLAGYGPVHADMARDTAEHGVWRRLLTDPVTGALLDYGRTTYRPPADLADHVRARDVTCRFPGCRQPAHRCDLDHTIEYPQGPTAPANLGALCRHHHRLKHEADWKVTQHEDGIFRWTSPTGRTYTTTPEHPVPDPPPTPAPPTDPAPDPPPF